MSANKKGSYTAADSLPVKLMQSKRVRSSITVDGFIPPLHVQFTPTNKCNLSCEFCSCAEDDRATEMSYPVFYDMLKQLKALGTEAMTITGGGEPTLHPNFDAMLLSTQSMGIKMGLVTNGLRLSKLRSETLNRLTWCRISHGDFRTFTSEYQKALAVVVGACDTVDWAFSYVVGPNPAYNTIEEVIQFANAHNFTHVRLVADLHCPEHVPMDIVQKVIKVRGVDDSKVIYQHRSTPEQGSSECYIGFLKPVIDAHGDIYACCGSQYAIKGRPRNMHPELRLGDVDGLQDIMYKNIDQALDGKICDVCYYGNYNRVLKAMVTEVEHKEFL